MEARRGCGFAGLEAAGVVWGRGEVVSRRCPRSVVSGESLSWLELFGARRWAGELSARDAEAMAVLEREMERVQHELERE
ncbi:MAG: hypothetical protein HY858_02450 [Candidatus Solibacter usitatus]|nr:hypothetical protein [Candidatus Solibacter usitatus]